MQHTIKSAVTLSGIGLHTGRMVTMTFLPAATNHGFKFKRIDLEGQPTIAADCDGKTSLIMTRLRMRRSAI